MRSRIEAYAPPSSSKRSRATAPRKPPGTTWKFYWHLKLVNYAQIFHLTKSNNLSGAFIATWTKKCNNERIPFIYDDFSNFLNALINSNKNDKTNALTVSKQNSEAPVGIPRETICWGPSVTSYSVKTYFIKTKS